MASLKTAQTFTSATKVVLKSAAGDVSVPALACGAWSWGDATWGYNEAEHRAGATEVWEALGSKGLGFYDTAEVYGAGESERIIGQLLKDNKTVERKDVVIATKWFPVPVFLNRWIPRGIVGALRGSLGRLGIETVDLYIVHAHWTWFYSINTIAKGLAECVKLGLTRTVGVSNYNTEQTIAMYEALKKEGVPLSSNQIEFSLLRRLPETSGLLAACHERDIVPLAYSPLGMGRLTGKYTVENPPPKGRRFSDYPMEDLQPLIEAMKKIAERENVAVSAVALNYVMSKGCIPLGGARNKHQAEQNMQALGWRLTDEDVTTLETLTKEGKTSWWQSG